MARLNVLFSGICDFVAQPDGRILVLLLDATKPLAPGQSSHRAYLRWRLKDVDAAKSTIAPSASNAKYAAVLLGNNDLLAISGTFKQDKFNVDDSFPKHVPRMDVLAKSSPNTSLAVRARMTLDRGELWAKPEESGHWWTLKRRGEKAAPGDPEFEFFNKVYLGLDEKDSATIPAGLTTTKGNLVIADNVGQVEFVVANLEGPLMPTMGPYTQLPQDLDFLYHYELASNPQPIKDRLIPTRVPKKPRGKRVDCYLAYWGEIQKGVQGSRSFRTSRSRKARR